MALDLMTGEIKWQLQTDFPPRVSPLVTDDVVFAGYIPFAKKTKLGLIMALDKKTGEKLWEYNIDAPIAPVGPSIGGGMLFIPTGKVQGISEKENAKGSIVAFGLP